jgi:hypothetical protein
MLVTCKNLSSRSSNLRADPSCPQAPVINILQVWDPQSWPKQAAKHANDTTPVSRNLQEKMCMNGSHRSWLRATINDTSENCTRYSTVSFFYLSGPPFVCARPVPKYPPPQRGLPPSSPPAAELIHITACNCFTEVRQDKRVGACTNAKPHIFRLMGMVILASMFSVL